MNYFDIDDVVFESVADRGRAIRRLSNMMLPTEMVEELYPICVDGLRAWARSRRADRADCISIVEEAVSNQPREHLPNLLFDVVESRGVKRGWWILFKASLSCVDCGDKKYWNITIDHTSPPDKAISYSDVIQSECGDAIKMIKKEYNHNGDARCGLGCHGTRNYIYGKGAKIPSKK